MLILHYAKQGEHSMKTILEDDRKIEALYYNDAADTQFIAGDGLEITAYAEPADGCFLTYFAVKEDGEIISRIPAPMVEVCYEPLTDQT